LLEARSPDLRQSQAVFYALAFFWLDGFAVPAPAQVSPKGDDVASRWTANCHSIGTHKEKK
jgi:hypothetical protein